MKILIIPIVFLALLCGLPAASVLADERPTPVDYVNPLVGTLSKHALSTGNTYPAIALPWGTNFWTPQTGVMDDGWAYTYDADKIRGFKQTHQPGPWMNDYGQFVLMPVTGRAVFGQDELACWFSHKEETATPYYKVYLADHDVTTELAPTERAALHEVQAGHAGGIISFKTRRGEQVNARVASSFISFEQAENIIYYYNHL